MRKLLFFAFLLCSTNLLADSGISGGRAPLRIRSSDLLVSSYPTVLQFPEGSLTINKSTASVQFIGLKLHGGATSYIQNGNTLQPNSIFYVSSGTVNNFVANESTFSSLYSPVIFTSTIIARSPLKIIATSLSGTVGEFDNITQATSDLKNRLDNVSIDTPAILNLIIISTSNKTTFIDVSFATSTKADRSEVSSSTSDKATISFVNLSTSNKTTFSDIVFATNTKADRSEVISSTADKATIDFVNTSSGNKTTYNQLNTTQSYLLSVMAFSSNPVSGLDPRFTLFKDTAEASIEGWSLFRATHTDSESSGEGFSQFKSTGQLLIDSWSLYKSTGETLTKSYNAFVSTGQVEIDKAKGWDLFKTTGQTLIQDYSLFHATAEPTIQSWQLFKSTGELKIQGWNLFTATFTAGASVAMVNSTFSALVTTSTRLSTVGTINTAGNPVDWTQLKGVPAGFADGDDAAGAGGASTVLLEGATNYYAVMESTFPVGQISTMSITFSTRTWQEIIVYSSGATLASQLKIWFNNDPRTIYAMGRIIAVTATSSVSVNGLTPYNVNSIFGTNLKITFNNVANDTKAGNIKGVLVGAATAATIPTAFDNTFSYHQSTSTINRIDVAYTAPVAFIKSGYIMVTGFGKR